MENSITSSSRSKVFKGLGSQSFVTIALGLLGILYFSIMSRLLTEEDFGYFAIVMAVTTILKSLTEAGLGSAVIQKKEAPLEFVSTAFTLSLILGFIFGVFLFVTSDFFSYMMVSSYELSWGYRIMSLSLVLYSINSIGRATIVKKLNFLRYGLYDIIAYVLSCLVGIYMAYRGYGYYASIVAMILHQAFITIIMIFFNEMKVKIRIYKEHINSIVSYGGWLTGSVIVRNITQEVDKLITTHWIPVSVLGAYNRPSGFISQITGNLNNIFDTILFPILSGINDSQERIRNSYEKSTILILLYSIILTAIFILGSDTLISIFLGNKWLYLDKIFQIVSLSIVFMCYGRLADCFYRSLGIVKSYFYTRCCVLICTIVSIFIGCQFGLFGLAVGVIFSRAADSIAKVIILQKYINMNGRKYYGSLCNALLVPFILFLVCYIIKIFIPYGGPISVTVFCVALFCVSVFVPKLLGLIYYDNIYMVVKSKIKK